MCWVSVLGTKPEGTTNMSGVSKCLSYQFVMKVTNASFTIRVSALPVYGGEVVLFNPKAFLFL